MSRRTTRSQLAACVALSGAIFCASLGLGGCNQAPTLPLPPPVVDIGSPNTQGLVTVSGEVTPQAYVSVLNERTEKGLITRADREGDFEVEIEAEVGDLITVWSEIDGEIGERKQSTVPAPR